ncbi:MAG: hypothetical protein RLZZ450_3395 [Pseudomonadota bacterium]|jgi:hypothetical protein
MIELSEIEKRVQGHGLVRGVDQLPRGHVRLETAFLYPDGSSIDVFLKHEASQPLLPATTLSDLGQTTTWLMDLQVKPWLSKKRQRIVEDVLRVHAVRQVGGALEIEMGSYDELLDDVVRLGQACARVADLTFTRRTSLQVSVDEEVEELLADFALDYSPNADLKGRFGAPVKVDFLVKGQRLESAILTLSSASSAASHTFANEVFRRWYDLDDSERTKQRVTVFDDRHDAYRVEDLNRIRSMSDLIALSDKQTLRDLLVA